MSSRLLLASSLSLLLAGAGCAHGMIAGTQIPDTEENREVYAVVEKALSALQARDAQALLSVVSKRYFEDNGTADQSDDYGYEELKDKYLPQTMSVAQEVHIDATVQDIVVDGDRAHADIRYHSRARLQFPSGSQWDSRRDFDRIELDREDGTWRIISGL